MRVIQEIKQSNEEPVDGVTTQGSPTLQKSKVFTPRQSSMVIETGDLGIASPVTMQNADDTSKDLSDLSHLSENIVFRTPPKLNTDRETKQRQTETDIQKVIERSMKPSKPSFGRAVRIESSEKSPIKHSERASLRASQPRRKGGFSPLRCCFAKNAVVVDTYSRSDE